MVTHSFPRVPGDIAGAFIWRLSEALAGRGHGVLVIAPADEGDVGGTTMGRVAVRRVRYSGARSETLTYDGSMHRLAAGNPFVLMTYYRLVRSLSRAVAEEIRSSGVHVVHAHWWIPAGLAVSRIERRGRPFVCTVHGPDVAFARRVPGGRALMTSVLRQATTVSAASGHLAVEIASLLGVPRDAVPVTPMPLALGISADPDQPRSGAIFVGRLTRQKGVHDLVEALALLKRDGRLVDLTIVGDGPERGNLKARALSLGINASFIGFVAPEDVGEYLRDKAVLALPAVDEDPGTAVAEALTQGVPVVATRSGGIPDLIVDPWAGILVPPSSPSALASAIQAVTSDERFRIGAARAGRVLADQLSPERVAERFEALYTRTRSSRASLAQSAAT